MAKAKKKGPDVYVEQRAQGDYAVRQEHSKRASAVEPTQAKAIKKARELFPHKKPVVERVHRTDTGKPGQWRKG
jgi:uncharacterized protein YdaT